MGQTKTRQSSIEALKLLGLTAIVISHVVLTVSSPSIYVPYDDYVINLAKSTRDIQYLLTAMLRYGGEFGNTIFFVCSAWFLLENKEANKRKVFSMLADVWVVSVLVLVVVLVCSGGHLSGSLILMSLFPTAFENNWYITCYIIFYVIHPVLNKIVNSVDQRSLFRLNTFAVILYFIIAFATRIPHYMFGIGTEFFSSRLIMWTVIYFILAYMKLYENEITSSWRWNVGLVIFGMFGNTGLICLTNVIGLQVATLSTALLLWIQPYNPFLVALGIGLLGLARRINFKNSVINYVSKLSLLIYIIHENKLLRLLYRPAMWKYIYDRYGYENILGWALLLSLVVFSFALVCSIIYNEFVRKQIAQICDKLYEKLALVWGSIERKVLKIN